MGGGRAFQRVCSVDIPSFYTSHACRSHQQIDTQSQPQSEPLFCDKGVTQLHVNPPPQEGSSVHRKVPLIIHTFSKLPSSTKEPSTLVPTPLIVSHHNHYIICLMMRGLLVHMSFL